MPNRLTVRPEAALNQTRRSVPRRTSGRARAIHAITSVFALAPGPCTATIGTFDGVHNGHRAVLEAGVAEARRAGMPLVAITFEPRPELFFRPNALPNLCASIDERVRLLRGAGAKHVCVLPFDEDVAGLSDVDFVQLLLSRLHARSLVVGEDFRLGHGKTGTPQRLTDLGLPTQVVPLVRDTTNEKVSSTALRLDRARRGMR